MTYNTHQGWYCFRVSSGSDPVMMGCVQSPIIGQLRT